MVARKCDFTDFITHTANSSRREVPGDPLAGRHRLPNFLDFMPVMRAARENDVMSWVRQWTGSVSRNGIVP